MGYQASTATVNAVLKTVYPGAISEQLNNEVGPWAVMEPKFVRIAQGQKIVKALHVGRNQSIAARTDLQRLPGAGVQRSVNAQINLARNYIIGQFTGGIVRDSYDDKAAFVNVMTDEMTRSLTDFTNDLARQVATGHARLAKLNGAAAGVTVLTVDSVLNLGKNMRIQIFNGATEQTPAYTIATDTGGVTITAVDRINSQITVDASVTASSGAFLYRAGNFDGTTVAEMNGLSTIVNNTGTYYNISRTTEPEIQAGVIDFVDTTTTPDASFEDKWQSAADLATIYGGTVVDLWYLDFTTRRRHLKQLQALRQYIVGDNAKTFGGGASSSKDFQRGLSGAVTFGDAPVVASRRIDAKTIYGLDTTTWEGFKQSEIEWLPNGDGSGGVLHPLLAAQGLDAFMFACNYDSQAYCSRPANNVRCLNTN